MRGSYGAGITDYLMDRDLYPFSFGIGVSAGVGNLGTYISRQRGRMKRYYAVYPDRPEYMSIRNIFTKGCYLDLDYVNDRLSSPDGEDPFDRESFISNRMDLTIVSTDGRTGKPAYFPKEMLAESFEVLKASEALPLVTPPIVIDGVRYFDGGISDPIPFRKAFSMGADRIVIILTRPKTYFRSPDKDRLIARTLGRKFPMAGEALSKRAETYNRELREALEIEKEGKVLILSPESTCGVTTLRHRAEDVEALYSLGYKDAESIEAFID